MRTLVWCAARGIPLYGPSGASAHLRGVARALSRRGHQVRVATLLPDDERGRWDDAEPLSAVHLPASARWPTGLRTAGARLDGHRLAAAAFRGERPDLLWERHEPASLAAGRWARWTHTTRLVELDAPLSLERRWPKRPRPEALHRETASLRAADRVLAVSTWLARWAVEEAGCAPERVRHVPNGVPPQRPGDRGAARKRLGLAGPVVGFLGSMRPWHGADLLPTLLDALGKEWTGLAVGGGEASPAPHPRLVATGPVHEAHVPDLISAMDVAIAPYRASAPPWLCPLKILQYRAQGVPVVAADAGDSRVLVGAGGEVIASEEPTAWAEAVRRQLDRAWVPWVRTWDQVVDEALR